jgi:REP element-mobilizing transposase RayT
VAIPYRGATTESTYFVTANVLGTKSLFQVDKIARLFIEVLLNYRTQKKYLLHEFVVMPDCRLGAPGKPDFGSLGWFFI